MIKSNVYFLPFVLMGLKEEELVVDETIDNVRNKETINARINTKRRKKIGRPYTMACTYKNSFSQPLLHAQSVFTLE